MLAIGVGDWIDPLCVLLARVRRLSTCFDFEFRTLELGLFVVCFVLFLFVCLFVFECLAESDVRIVFGVRLQTAGIPKYNLFLIVGL